MKHLAFLRRAAVATLAMGCSSHLSLEAGPAGDSSIEGQGPQFATEDLLPLGSPAAGSALSAEVARWPLLSGMDPGLPAGATFLEQPAEVDGVDPAGSASSPLRGVWRGTLSYRFFESGSEQVSMTVNASGEGVLVLGQGKAPPAPRADEYFPAGHYEYPHPVPATVSEGWFPHDDVFRWGVYEGFPYPIQLLRLATGLEALGLRPAVTLRASRSALFAEWCGLQQVPETAATCGAMGHAMARYAVPTGTDTLCDYYASDPELSERGALPVIIREPCWKQLACLQNCECHGGECRAREDHAIQLDGQLEADTISGWLRFPAPPLGDAVVAHTILRRAPEDPR